MEKSPFPEYWNVTHVTETSEIEYGEALLNAGWKLISAGTRYFDGDMVSVLVFGWVSDADPVYPKIGPEPKRLEAWHK